MAKVVFIFGHRYRGYLSLTRQGRNHAPKLQSALIAPLVAAGAVAIGPIAPVPHTHTSKRSPHRQWVWTEAARPRRTACVRAMRIMGPTRGVAQEAWASRE